MTIDIPRETALKILYDVNENGAYSNISINKHLHGSQLRDIDRAFITDIVYGTVKWRLTIDWIINQFSSVKVKKISPWILNILRLGIYQLLYMEKVPASAACNESVNLSRKYGHQAASRYVNGVLRNIARNRMDIRYPDKNIEFEKYLSVKYSHPEWMITKWVRLYGRDFTEELLESNNEIPDFSVRVNTLKISREQLLEELKRSGMVACEGKYVDEAVVIMNPSSVSKLEVFRKGYIQVQDESSMLVAKILDPKPGEYIMDVCSAPGGKATHIAQLMNNIGTIVARDIHEHKIKLINDSAKRLGINIIKTEIFDASKIDTGSIEKADRVLVDAPCTGLGIIRRKPDIKWSKDAESTKEITELQSNILNKASKYVKPNGVLVYSTCTINSEENIDVVRNFLEENKEFYPVDFSEELPVGINKTSACEGYIQLYQNVDKIDGFFIAKMKKRG